MAENAEVSIEIDAKIRDIAAQVLEGMGLTISEAIRLMLFKTAKDQCLPFNAEEILHEEYPDELPNDLTLETFRKIDRGEEIHHAKDLKDLLKQLRS